MVNRCTDPIEVSVRAPGFEAIPYFSAVSPGASAKFSYADPLSDNVVEVRRSREGSVRQLPAAKKVVVEGGACPS